MKKGMMKIAAACVGLAVVLGACGQNGGETGPGTRQEAEGGGTSTGADASAPDASGSGSESTGGNSSATDASGSGSESAGGNSSVTDASGSGSDSASAGSSSSGASGSGSDSAGAGSSATDASEQGGGTEAVDGLAQLYEENFPIGIALPGFVFQNLDTYGEVILDNFNSITCENEMKPDFLLDRAASQAGLGSGGDGYTRAAVHFDSCQPAISFALEHGLKIRFHTLVWHSQTPKWFFTEDYTEGGKLVDRETMLARMENYIADVLGYFQENYPGLIYAVDVVNEAFDVGNGDENGVRMKDNLWYDTVGDDYYYQAFVFARRYAAEDMKLFYNDYGCMDKTELILGHLEQAKKEGLVDGIGMQSHLSVDDKIQYKFMLAVKKFCDSGYEVQATELDIGVKENSEKAFKTQGRKYRSFFKNMRSLQEEGYAITGITVWGLNDKLSWRTGEYGLMFDEDMNPKPAYLGAMMDASVPDVE